MILKWSCDIMENAGMLVRVISEGKAIASGWLQALWCAAGVMVSGVRCIVARAGPCQDRRARGGQGL